jgi:hypothetical protein
MDRILDELKGAARLAGVEVREVPLGMPDQTAQSGLVKLRGTAVLFLDPAADRDEAVRLLVQALAGRDLDDLYLSPAARALLEERQP